MDIYDRIEVLLKRQKINKKELCEKSKVSYNTLASLFRRRSKNIDLETLKNIAITLDTSTDYLIMGNDLSANPRVVKIYNELTSRSKDLLESYAEGLYANENNF